MADTRLRGKQRNTNRRWRPKIVSTSEGAGGPFASGPLGGSIGGQEGHGTRIGPRQTREATGTQGSPNSGVGGAAPAGSGKLELLQVSQLPPRGCICMTLYMKDKG